MSGHNFSGPKLPKDLLDKINPNRTTAGGPGNRRHPNAPLRRKEQRKALREGKKKKNAKRRQFQPPINSHGEDAEAWDGIDSDDDEDLEPPVSTKVSKRPTKERISKSSNSNDDSELKDTAPRISRAGREALAQDDAEIADLEKKLGMRGTKKRPKQFAEDGLDELLDGIDDVMGFGDGEKRRNEDDEWLQRKRLKTLPANYEDDLSEPRSNESEEGISDDTEDGGGMAEDYEDEESEEDLDAISDVESNSPKPPAKRKTRENPYIPPVTDDGATTTTTTTTKYIPPSLRNPSGNDTESLTRLRRQTQGLLNRLSEANMLTILGDVESLYRSNPRQYVTTTLIDLLILLICDRTSLMDTFVILHAGFTTAIYKSIGPHFGAQFLERLIVEFDKFYQPQTQSEPSTKETSNLIAMLANLYTFQLVSGNIIFDYIRLLLSKLSGLNTELLLKLIRSCGHQLRQDDPRTLKDIVFLLQKSVAENGEDALPVRTKFMIEMINDLKNNRMKTGAAASAVASEHIVRMKKMLGSLNTRNVNATEPLGIGLEDIRGSKKEGKWWLVGASWKNDVSKEAETQPKIGRSGDVGNGPVEDSVTDDGNGGSTNLLQLAKEQRMNTDIRRAIFVNIMSATDYKEASIRLLKLKLMRSQEVEIPRVLIHCAGAEQEYNPYYSLIAKKFCAEHKLRMAFQYSLWSLFRQMGEKDDFSSDDTFHEDDEVDLRKLVNLARTYAELVSSQSLPITILKVLNFAYLQSKTKTFLEIMLVSIFENLEKRSKSENDEKLVVEVFARAKEAPQMLAGLQYFLSNVVSSSTLVKSSGAKKKTLRHACRTAVDTLAVILSSTD